MKPDSCWNSERQEGYWVKDGVIVKGGIGIQIMRYIKDTSTKNCQYRLDKPNDKICDGCAK